MSRQQRRLLGVVAMAVVIGGPVGATSVTLSEPFIRLNNAGFNTLGFRVGTYISGGADVLPFDLAGPDTTAIASTTDTTSGLSFVRPMKFDGNVSAPSFYDFSANDSPGLRGSWSLSFTNDGDTTTAPVSFPGGTTPVQFISDLTESGSLATPMFNWVAPTGGPVQGYRVSLFDHGLISKNGQHVALVYSHSDRNTWFQVPTELDGGLHLDSHHLYTLEIDALETRDGGPNLDHANVFTESNTYFDFRPAPRIDEHTYLYLPMPDADGGFHYLVTDITAGTTIEVDPSVAIGYIYATGMGDPNFASVDLPTGIGDGKYDIYGRNAAGDRILLAHDWLGGDVFDFGADGVNWFEVLGIEDGAMIDPSDTTAFVTGLTFTGDGSFTGTQTPVTALVPEPSGLAVFGAGALGFLLLAVRRRRSRFVVLGAVLTGVAGCAAAPPAPPPGTQLSAAGLRATLVGNTVYGSDGNRWIAYYAPDRGAKTKYAWGVDSGVWRITNDGRWCTRWNNIRHNTEWCQTVFQDGNTVRFVHDGSVSSTGQLKAENPENL